MLHGLPVRREALRGEQVGLSFRDTLRGLLEGNGDACLLTCVP
jgi:hypothetical protein